MRNQPPKHYALPLEINASHSGNPADINQGLHLIITSAEPYHDVRAAGYDPSTTLVFSQHLECLG
jgi:hypothetical protein